jgi:rod shape-determining protein MreD
MHFLRVRGVEPSLVLVVVVWYAIRVDSLNALVYGACAGLLEDVLAPGTGAAWMVSTTMASLLAGTISRGFFADSLPLVAIITIAATLIRQLAFWTMRAIAGYPPGLGMLHLHEALLQALLNAALMLIAMVIARRFERSYS